MQAVYGEVRALGAEIVVLSPELPNFSADLARHHKLAFPILNDHGLAIAKAFGLVFTLPDDLKEVYLNAFKNDLAKRNGEPSWQLPMPARFVIDRGGVLEEFSEARAGVGESPGWQLDLKAVESLPDQLILLRCHSVCSEQIVIIRATGRGCMFRCDHSLWSWLGMVLQRRQSVFT